MNAARTGATKQIESKITSATRNVGTTVVVGRKRLKAIGSQRGDENALLMLNVLFTRRR